ncbi:hypothetical protein [Natrialba asiatica]|uniref:Uncharacterized protein n=1 Tax=Natrialba asiatica (strain ATCC 700177 / DSM 12278 / JCM 9576 / FERM P-10747 / NBRC 102637 / 172P1) TaxID=29540 RepID=M0ALC6_NATA1|nr:hypothetical protein [Natrialba asiatica]ELY99495.1 hypothetical protein C481_14718 [Natrialba asiatica DSM 12278]
MRSTDAGYGTFNRGKNRAAGRGMTSAASHRTDVTDRNEVGSENDALAAIFGSTNRGERGRRIRTATAPAIALRATIDEGSKRIFTTQIRSSTAVKPATTGRERLTAAGEKADDRNVLGRPHDSDSPGDDHNNGDSSSRASSLPNSHSARGSRNRGNETNHVGTANPHNSHRNNSDSDGCPRTSRVVTRSRRADRPSTASLDGWISTASSKRTFKTRTRSNTAVRPDSRTAPTKGAGTEFAAIKGPIDGLAPDSAISADNNPSHSTSGVTTPNPSHDSDASVDTMTPLSVAATEPNPSSVRVSRADPIVHSHRSTDGGPRTRNRTAEGAIGR